MASKNDIKALDLDGFLMIYLNSSYCACIPCQETDPLIAK